jgi:hypothetical protein
MRKARSYASTRRGDSSHPRQARKPTKSVRGNNRDCLVPHPFSFDAEGRTGDQARADQRLVPHPASFDGLRWGRRWCGVEARGGGRTKLRDSPGYPREAQQTDEVGSGWGTDGFGLRHPLRGFRSEERRLPRVPLRCTRGYIPSPAARVARHPSAGRCLVADEKHSKPKLAGCQTVAPHTHLQPPYAFNRSSSALRNPFWTAGGTPSKLGAISSSMTPST